MGGEAARSFDGVGRGCDRMGFGRVCGFEGLRGRWGEREFQGFEGMRVCVAVMGLEGGGGGR